MIKKQLNLHTDINQNTNSKTNALTLCALAYNFSVLKYRLSKHKFIHTILIFYRFQPQVTLNRCTHKIMGKNHHHLHTCVIKIMYKQKCFRKKGRGDIFINFTPSRIVLADTWNIIMIILFLDI